MQKYLFWNKKTITDFSENKISSLYNEGYVFTRLSKGEMGQTRSVRIDLKKFEISSENKRILRKTKDISYTTYHIPYTAYHWSIGKLGKDFYEKKFGKGIFSANKIKELLSCKEKSNFNKLFVFSITEDGLANEYCHCKITTEQEGLEDLAKTLPIGYAICYENNEMLHYSYPFYNLEFPNKSIGMGMMVRAVKYAKEQGKKYIYLGSAQRPGDTYKLQFKGIEWFDGKNWNNDLEELKEVLKEF